MGALHETGTSHFPALINDCWNEIGVQGDGSCPELQGHIHCRNCPAYAAAASALLDRDVAPGHIEASTRHFSVAHEIEEPGTVSIVIFRIGTEWLAFPTAVFSEFVDVRPIHSLPHRRDDVVLGLTNVRGELLVCVSLAQMLGIEHEAKSRKARQGAVYNRLVVIREKDSRIAFPVDEVHGIHKFSPGRLGEVPATVAKAAATYTRAMLPWQDTAVGCLDEQLLFYALNRSLA
jgi:chemotaxis-related protein WspD